MGKLRDLLQTEADRYRNEKTKRQQALNEWLELLNSLFAQIDSWLKASDPDNLLEILSDELVANDPALGEYKAPMRRITLGKTSVEIVPRARYVIATIQPPNEQPVRAHGLVEIRSRGFATHNLYQLPGGLWYIFDRSSPLSTGINAVEPLNADRFEAALASLLR
ncbi:hypothetical protein VT84_01555 [Gemmata sp. SH-PL17]|uniref:hypothetical protein n=1 Tax=Gemmata sp. SH-PL17 TaxID=1630693 RepID=UPI00078CB7FE|nr:hypothetical protein [Gemmata sp. SH-PL17]AMV23067.1 hypothetical protein VT84_01555 [Gemmata sp. SH-PL17]